ncbi:MAG: hypothetical protein AMS27_08065 [Bacteroides sp. SM23_62_1]|nr:MAG: hypothetical protein AMS27_08065 [Bacteroides sp. SM23_62_1]
MSVVSCQLSVVSFGIVGIYESVSISRILEFLSIRHLADCRNSGLSVFGGLKKAKAEAKEGWFLVNRSWCMAG